MSNAILDSVTASLSNMRDGAPVMICGFGTAVLPETLFERYARELVIVDNVSNGGIGLAAQIARGRVRKMICRFRCQANSWHFDRGYRVGSYLTGVATPEKNLGWAACVAYTQIW